MNASTPAGSDPEKFPPLLHYIDEHGLDVLIRRELKITPPGEFNDPFEFWTTTPTGFTKEQVKQLFLSERGLHRRHFQEVLRIPREVCESSVDNLPDPSSAEGQRIYEIEFRELRRISLSPEALDGLFGVTCCSTESSPNDPSLDEQHARMLMWGRYAKGHRGMLIEYDFNQCGPPHDLATRDHLWKISNYADSPPPMRLEDFAHVDPNHQAAVLRRWGSTKAEPWRHEREWRLMAPQP